MKPTKLQREWLERISKGPIQYQQIPESVRKACKASKWAIPQVWSNMLCYIITPAGRAVLEEEKQHE